MTAKLYYIRVQQKTPYNGKYPRHDWRAYRKFLAWPITFTTPSAAHEFMDVNFTFKNIPGRKLSASVERCR